LDKYRILDRIVDLVGVKLTDEAIKVRGISFLVCLYLTSQEYHESSLSTFELVGSDIIEVYPKVKHMNIVDYAEVCCSSFTNECSLIHLGHGLVNYGC
jgi:hypothetical protein